jgi:repressor LexA
MIGDNIRKIRDTKGLTINELSTKAKVSLGYLSDLENNNSTNPSAKTLQKIADALEVTVPDFYKSVDSLFVKEEGAPYNYLGNLTEIKDTPLERAINYVVEENRDLLIPRQGNDAIFTTVLHPIPILGVIRAGEPLRAEQNIIGYEYLPEEMLKGGECFGLKVTGDSMNNSRIVDGDVVIVREQPEVNNGDIAVVLVNGDEATVKKFYKTDSTVTLLPNSTNAIYQPIIIDTTKTPVKVLGKVIKVIMEI